MSVAVVIANRNYAEYLGRAIDSARRQTRRPDEIIVVDGESTDTSFYVATSRQDVRWVSQPPRGQAGARNYGVLLTHCEYIVPLDADDWIEPDYIARTLGAMVSGVGIVATGLVWPDGRVQYPDVPITEERLYQANRLFCCSLFRREAWLKVGGYDEGPTYEDWELWLSIVRAGYEVAVVRRPLFHYTVHARSSTAHMDVRMDIAYREYIQLKHQTVNQ